MASCRRPSSGGWVVGRFQSGDAVERVEVFIEGIEMPDTFQLHLSGDGRVPKRQPVVGLEQFDGAGEVLLSPGK
jgi:hypothetical protein